MRANPRLSRADVGRVAGNPPDSPALDLNPIPKLSPTPSLFAGRVAAPLSAWQGRFVGTDRSVPTLVYSTTSVMTPEPTVLPPSRMAKWLPMASATPFKAPQVARSLRKCCGEQVLPAGAGNERSSFASRTSPGLAAGHFGIPLPAPTNTPAECSPRRSDTPARSLPKWRGRHRAEPGHQDRHPRRASS